MKKLIVSVLAGLSLAGSARILPETKVYCQAQFYPLHEMDKGYLGRFTDQPLFMDPGVSAASPYGTRTPQADLELFERQIAEYGIDGFTYFPAWGRVAVNGFEALSANSPKGMTHPPQIAFWYKKDVDTVAFGKALKDPCRLEVDGKTVIFLYNAQMAYKPEQLTKLLDEMRALYGDGFLTCGDFHSIGVEYRESFAKRGRVEASLEAAFKERMRTYLRVLDGLYFGGGCMLFKPEKRARVFDVGYYRESLRMAKEVLDEPEFKGRKFFGCTAEMSHENPGASSVWLCRDGTRTLRRSFETAMAADPDFIILPEWDEWNENTCFCPSLYNSFAPLRIIRFYMQKLRHRPVEPRAGDDLAVPNLITSYRKRVAPGELFYVETVLVPDGSEKGPVTVAVELCDENGTLLERLGEKSLAADGTIAEARWETKSEELAKKARILDVRVRWRRTDGTSGEMKNLVPCDLVVANTWDHKEVSACLRDTVKAEKADVRFADGRLAADLAFGEPLRYVFAMANGRITWIPHPGDPVEAFRDGRDRAVFAITSSRPNGGSKPSFVLAVPGVPDAAWLVPQKAPKKGESFRPEAFSMPGEIYLSVPKAKRADSLRLTAKCAGWCDTAFDLRRIHETGAYVFSDTNGVSIAVARLDRQSTYPQVLNDRAVKFDIDMPNSGRESTAYHLMAVTMSGKLWCSKSFVRERAAETVPVRVYSAMDDRVKTIALPRARVPRMDYDFSPTHGDAIRTADGKNRDFWGMRGAAYHPLTQCARVHGLDGPLKVVANKMKPGGQRPARIREPDGSWSFAFDGVNDNLQFPLETLPAQSGYTVSLEFFPTNPNRAPETLMASRVTRTSGTLRQVYLKNGALGLSWATSAELYPHDLNTEWERILWIEYGQWNRLTIAHEGDAISVTLNGRTVRREVVPGGDHASSFVIGGFPLDGFAFFKGRIRNFSVDHAAPSSGTVRRKLACNTADAAALARGREIRDRILATAKAGGGTVDVPVGTYVFDMAEAESRRLFISNHDQLPERKVVFPLEGAKGLTIRSTGAKFLFRGQGIPFAILRSSDIRLEGLSLDWERPFLTEMTIVGYENGKTRVKLDRKRFPCEMRDGRLLMLGEDWAYTPTSAKLFDGRTRELVEGSGDIDYGGLATASPDGTFLLDFDFAKCGRGGKFGDVIALRPWPRPCPAVFVADSRRVELVDFAVHTSLGMALVAQRSEDVSWMGTVSPEARRNGVFPSGGRYASAQADATHFSNVKGLVTVENGLFEGMMDDAINVHSTCLRIEKVEDPETIRCRYMHYQSIGFDVFRAGETLRFIRGKTNEYGPAAKVKSVRRLNAELIVVALDRAVPAGYGVGDTVDNDDWRPAVTFRGNVVRWNRARGSLFTTPKPVLVESNLFDRVSGAAIVFSGDAYYWYESGACADVLVRKNVFSNCLTCARSHGSSSALFSISPKVHDLKAQRQRYHRNIRIEDNDIFTYPVRLLGVTSADGVAFRNNRIRLNRDYAAWPDERLFSVEAAENVTIGMEKSVPADWLDRTVLVESALDGTAQFAYFAPQPRGKKVPLMVGLHTWSYDLTQLAHYAGELDWCRRHGWAFVGPNYRGPNWTSAACGGDLAVQDIVDAVNYAKSYSDIDADRVYITGGSGGGHMTLLMAGRHPEIWAGCAAFCPILDFVAWRGESQALEHNYWRHVEKACGGTPAERPSEYAHRSPITHLAAAKGVPVMIGTGIHDGHKGKGSVPVAQAIRGYNCLAAEKDRIADADIDFMVKNERVPDHLLFKGTDPFYPPKKRVLLRKTSGNVQLTLFESAHDCNFAAAFDFFTRQRRGQPADWTLPEKGEVLIQALTK